MTPPTPPGLPRRWLDHLWARGREFLGTETALMGGGMTWVSERHLVAAIAEGGGFGVLAAGSMAPALLRDEIVATRTLTARPFGVNLIVMHPQIEELLAVCAEQRVSHLVLAGALPRDRLVQQAKATGARVLAFAPALVAARKLIRLGVDALIIEGSEAGGHIGPVSTFVLAQEILPEIDAVPVFVAGGIGRGDAMLGFLELGAAGVQIGTRFACATESVAHPRFKQALLKAASRDAVASVQVDPRFPVNPVRGLINEATRGFPLAQHDVIRRYESGVIDQSAAQLAIEHYWAGALRRAVVDGDIAHGSLMAGQSVGLVWAEQPAAAIIAQLTAEAEAALARRLRLLAALTGPEPETVPA